MRSICVTASLLLLLLVCLCCSHAQSAEPGEETLYLQSGGQLTGRSIGVENGQIRWELEPQRELLIPVDWIERLEVTPASVSLPVPSDISQLESTLTATAATPISTPSAWEDIFGWAESVQDWSTNVLSSFEYWTSRVQIGGQFIEGNARTDLVDVAAELEKGTPTQMRQVEIGGQWGRNKQQQTANRWFMNNNFDWPVREGSPWITFITSKNEYNAVQNLDYRGTVSSGGGYRFFYNDKRRLVARFGPAFTVEVFHDPQQRRYTPDLFGELELRWPVRPHIQFENKFRVQPSMLDFELVRVFTTTGVLWNLDGKDRWKLRLGLQYNYNSQPNAGRVPSDYISSVSLVYVRK